MIYIAAPFFNPEQLALVKAVEAALTEAELPFYSPRSDGVLQDMTPEQRVNSYRKIFNTNVQKINDADLMLALLDHKDSGTTWELGLAYGVLNGMTYGFTSAPNVKLNVMLGQCLEGHIVGMDDLKKFLQEYKDGIIDDRPFKGEGF